MHYMIDEYEKHVAEVLELAPMGAFLADRDGHCFFVNKEWERMSGLSFQESTGKGWFNIIIEEDRAPLIAIMEKYTRPPFDMPDHEFRIQHSQLGIRHLVIKGRIPLDAKGEPLFIVGYVQDVTEERLNMYRLRALAANLEQSNQLLDISQEISKTGGWELNLLTREMFWTKQTYAIYNLAEDYVPTFESSMVFFDEEERTYIAETLATSIEEKSTFILEAKTTTPTNEKKWVRVIGVPFIEDGVVTLLRGAIMDITGRKEDELTLIRARDKAESAAKSKAEFLSVMSHEIRTPLNGIIGITSLLLLDHTPEQEKYISNLSLSANHLMDLINDMLDLHKMESGNIQLDITAIDLSAVVLNVVAQFKPMAEAKNIRLETNIHTNIPGKVMGDTLRLNQILNNLISNAVKYTEKGEVVISLQPVSVTAQKATIHFSVKDTGIGIPEELHKAVFESFRQAQQDSFRKHPGTGLGLTITKKLVELHNGFISIKSNVGEGTELYFDLTFDLPVQQGAVPRTTRLSAISGHEKKFTGLKVLFVEDNYVNVIVAKRQLEYLGIVPDCAQSAFEAIELMKCNDYHIALLDLHMPEMDGYALAEMVQKEYPHVHIVIFTADIIRNVQARLAQMNIFDILSKPFMPEEMLNTLLRIVQQRSFKPGTDA